jgi:hypothetical protein
MRASSLVVAVPLALVAATSAPRAIADEAEPDAKAIGASIDRGAAWLTTRFHDGFADTSWHAPTELVVLALAHAGVNLTDPVFRRGVETIEQAEPRFTYRTALRAMALAEVNPRLYQKQLAHCAQWLVDTQLLAGEWGYPGAPEGSYLKQEGYVVPPPPPPEDDPKRPADAPRDRWAITRRIPAKTHVGVKGDFSNTQLAILGLRACRDAGIEIPKETWKGAVDYLRAFQRKDGGWGYVLGGTQDDASYASLTCAGVCSAAIGLAALGTPDVRADPLVKKALGWITKNLDLAQNVGIDRSAIVGPRPWQYYHLYSVERAARVLGVAELGGRPWYARGATWLLAHQQADGGWVDEAGPGAQPPYLQVADTCFALLFLTRATRPLTGK